MYDERVCYVSVHRLKQIPVHVHIGDFSVQI